MSRRPDVAYYYPAPFWRLRESSWVKSLLLFFDHVAILLPNYMYGRHRASDITLVDPLEERGLLKVLEPTDWIDDEMANKLAEIVLSLLKGGAFDDLPNAPYFAELSMSRMGYAADVELAESLVDELEAAGLARPSEDGVSIPLHPTVRTTVLVVLGQLSRLAGSKRGMACHPTTSHPQAISDLVRTLSREEEPSTSRVIQLDLERVAFDLESVPLDDVLQFRKEHKDTHRDYMREVRGFMVELAMVEDPEQRELMLRERRQQIRDAAHDLQLLSSRAMGKNLFSWTLGISGTAWSATTGDPLGAVLATLGLVTNLIGGPEVPTVYSYLFASQKRFSAN